MGVPAMKTDRLMAFTDAVLAIAITIMVVDLPVPASRDWQAIEPVARCWSPMPWPSPTSASSGPITTTCLQPQAE